MHQHLFTRSWGGKRRQRKTKCCRECWLTRLLTTNLKKKNKQTLKPKLIYVNPEPDLLLICISQSAPVLLKNYLKHKDISPFILLGSGVRGAALHSSDIQIKAQTLIHAIPSVWTDEELLSPALIPPPPPPSFGSLPRSQELTQTEYFSLSHEVLVKCSKGSESQA